MKTEAVRDRHRLQWVPMVSSLLLVLPHCLAFLPDPQICESLVTKAFRNLLYNSSCALTIVQGLIFIINTYSLPLQWSSFFPPLWYIHPIILQWIILKSLTTTKTAELLNSTTLLGKTKITSLSEFPCSASMVAVGGLTLIKPAIVQLHNWIEENQAQ